MTRFIASVGSTIIIAVAIAVLLGATTYGGIVGQSAHLVMDPGSSAFIGAVIGLLCGVVFIGVWLGPLAALYAISKDMKRLADRLA